MNAGSPPDPSETVSCRFTTSLPADLQIQDAEYAIPVGATRLELSQLINTLIGRDKPLAFDFIVNGIFLHTALGDHLSLNGLSAEQVLEVEYILAQLPPSDSYTLRVSDWVSSIVPSIDQHFELAADLSDAAVASLYDGSLVVFKFAEGEREAHAVLSSQASATASAVITGTRHHTTKLFSTPIRATCLVGTADTSLIASGGYEGRIICSALTGDGFTHELEYAGVNSPVLSLSSTPDRRWMAAGTVDGRVLLYDVTQAAHEAGETETEPGRKRAHGRASSRVHGRRIIKSSTHEIPFTFQSARTSEARRYNPFTVATDINCLAFSADTGGPCVAAGCADNCVRFYDIARQAPVGLISTPAACQALRFMPTSANLVVCGFHNKLARLYDLRLEKPVVQTFTGHKSSITCVDVRDNMIITGSIGGDLCVWDARSAIPVWTIDCFYRTLEHKRDQSRLLACAFGINRGVPVFYHGGSDRRVTMRST